MPDIEQTKNVRERIAEIVRFDINPFQARNTQTKRHIRGLTEEIVTLYQKPIPRRVQTP